MKSYIRSAMLLSSVALFAAEKGAGAGKAKAETVNQETGEVTEKTDAPATGTSIAERAMAKIGMPVGLAGGKFKVKQQVTHSVLRQKDGETIFVTILGPIYQGEELKSQRANTVKMAPAKLAKVIDLDTPGMTEAVVIVNTVLEGELIKAFPNLDKDGKQVSPDKDGEYVGVATWGYVGKSLAIRMNAAREGTRYKTFDILELELDA